MGVLAVVAPGQGAQKPEMLTPWLELDGARDLLGNFGESAGIDLIGLGTTPGADVTDTAHAQPLLAAAALLAARYALPGGADDATGLSAVALGAGVGAVAGHSVGEFPAAVLAGALGEDDAMRLVALRGRLMARAAGRAETSMAAVIGGETEQVTAAAQAAGLEPANFNGGGQIVVAGPLPAIQAFAATPPPGLRVVPLAVAGAFHTAYMASARDALTPELAGGEDIELAIPFISNANGEALSDAGAVRSSLASQVTSPVRWDLCQDALARLGVTGMIELAPGGVLTGLARRAMPGVATCAIKSPADLPKARAFATEHGAPAAGAPARQPGSAPAQQGADS